MKTIAGAILILAACLLFAGSAIAGSFVRNEANSLLNWGGLVVLVFGVTLLSVGVGMESMSSLSNTGAPKPNTVARVVVMMVSLLVALAIIGTGLLFVFKMQR